MKYSSCNEVKSKDGTVVFVLKKMNGRKRDRLAEIQEPLLARVRPLQEEFKPLDAEYLAASKAARAVGAAEREAAIAGGATAEAALAQFPIGKVEFADEKFARWRELSRQLRAIDAKEMTPATVGFVLVRIDGFDIDGEAVTDLEGLLDRGPDELYGELQAAVARELGLMPAEIENLSSPSTSAAAVDGTSSTGSADRAGTPVTTTVVDAGSFTAQGSAVVEDTVRVP